MINIILVMLLLALLLPMFGVYVVAGTVGLLLKILFVVILIGLILNLLPASGTRGRWW